MVNALALDYRDATTAGHSILLDEQSSVYRDPDDFDDFAKSPFFLWFLLTLR